MCNSVCNSCVCVFLAPLITKAREQKRRFGYPDWLIESAYLANRTDSAEKDEAELRLLLSYYLFFYYLALLVGVLVC